jgi:hypothetical protein
MILGNNSIKGVMTMYSKPPMSNETKEYLIKKLRKMKETIRKQNKFSKKNNWIEFYKQKEKTK